MHLFDKGWNELRETIFANQKKLGVIPANTQLTAWPDSLPKWDTLSADEKKLFVRQADIFAAYAAYTDHEIGRVIQAVEDMGKLDNTLIIYISGDNGCSPEGSTIGTPFDLAAIQAINIPVETQLKFYDVLGSDVTTPHMAVAWSWALIRRSNGPKRSPPTSAARGRAWSCRGPAVSRMWAASARSSTTSLTSCRRSSKPPAFRRR